MRQDKGLLSYFSKAKGKPKTKKKIKGAWRVCKECGAVSRKKRWNYGIKIPADVEVEETLCPGCERIKKKQIDGWVELRTNLLLKNPEEVLGLIKHTEEDMKKDDPVNRILNMEIKGNIADVTTTSEFLAKRIGEEFKKAYKGKLKLTYDHGFGQFLYVIWQDDDFEELPEYPVERRGLLRTKPKTKRRKKLPK